MKRSFDILVSVIGLILLSPLMVAVAIWVKLDSPGPVFYRGMRAGQHNREFSIYKFRSMTRDAESLGGSSTAGGDPRVTRSGSLIRRFKIDELSQLINVLLGDMSLVGPRPEIFRYTNQYEGDYRDILSIRPGITDWASIWNADEATVLEGADDADRAYEVLIQPTKLELQLRYVRHRTFLTDIRILAYTIRRIVEPAFYPTALTDVPRLSPGMGTRCNRAP